MPIHVTNSGRSKQGKKSEEKWDCFIKHVLPASKPVQFRKVRGRGDRGSGGGLGLGLCKKKRKGMCNIKTRGKGTNISYIGRGLTATVGWGVCMVSDLTRARNYLGIVCASGVSQ